MAGGQGMSQDITHVKLSALSYKDHVTKQVPDSLQNYLLGLSLVPWFLFDV